MTQPNSAPDPLVDELPRRYVVGIDLGTTNSAVAYVDTQQRPWRVDQFAVDQLVAPGIVESRETLPSFHFQPRPDEVARDALQLPWSRSSESYAVGFAARDEGARQPGRLIGSAKSWLCHAGVDRTAALLPWHGDEDVERLSPVQVSSRYLRHMRLAWNARHPRDPLEDQDLVLTLPASFDEVARELTVAAAAEAGLTRVVLIEEPQAAFYAWVYRHQDDWHQLVSAGQKILVCDIGGGTSDFTLIRVRRIEDAEGQHRVQFHRVAVGEHLILGGDNLDLALAVHLEQQLEPGGKLPTRQWDVLLRGCRRIKETLLAESAPDSITFNLAAGGSKLIGGGRQFEVQREQVQSLLVDGFLPPTTLDDEPQRRQSGFQEFGLPFAPDPAITRYLASFLRAHRHVALEDEAVAGDTDPARPDVVLFNGGFFASPVLRQRLLEVMSSWFSSPQAAWQPIVLDNDRLDLAVSRGAAYYGMVRRGEGVRIAASLARSYYIHVQSDPPAAVCLVPGNAEPGQDIDLSQRRFQLKVSQPVEFPLYVSSTRLVDRPGDLVAVDHEQLKSLPPIRTVLKTGRGRTAHSLLVELHARLTEIGTIDLWCSQTDGDQQWKLRFDVRSATQTDRTARPSTGESQGVIDETLWNQCIATIRGVFGPEAAESPERLVKSVADVLQLDRRQWPMSLLRRIWEALLQFQEGRRRSPVHEARWLNLLGYALRPGYGLAVDDWRVTETWRHVQGKLVHATPAIRTESLILWRRLAGGLSKGQQLAVAEPLLAGVRGIHRAKTGTRKTADVSFSSGELVEAWRLLGSLELLAVPVKVELGNLLVELLDRRKLEPARAAMIWALGRLGQRTPVYGPLNTVVPAAAANQWVRAIMTARYQDPASAGSRHGTRHLAVMQLSRRTGDRYRDLADQDRDAVADWLEAEQAATHLVELVRQVGQLDDEEQSRVFGEALPMGLQLS